MGKVMGFIHRLVICPYEADIHIIQYHFARGVVSGWTFEKKMAKCIWKVETGLWPPLFIVAEWCSALAGK